MAALAPVNKIRCGQVTENAGHVICRTIKMTDQILLSWNSQDLEKRDQIRGCITQNHYYSVFWTAKSKKQVVFISRNTTTNKKHDH